MPAVVRNRPPCKHCERPLDGIRCGHCGRWNLIRYLTSGFMARW